MTWIDDAEKWCKAATPNWSLERGNVGGEHPLFAVTPGKNGIRMWSDADTEFAVHVRTDLPRALSVLRVAINALEEIGEGIGCNSPMGEGCDMRCKRIAYAALAAIRRTGEQKG